MRKTRAIIPQSAFAGMLLLFLVLTGCKAKPATWNAIQYKIYTGHDDLDGGRSTAAAYLKLNNGQEIACMLNSIPPGQSTYGVPVLQALRGPQFSSWGNDTTNIVTCPLNGVSGWLIPGSKVWISMWQESCDTGCDNWDLEGLNVTLLTNNNPSAPGPTTCELNVGFFGPGDNRDNPAVARLTGGQSDVVLVHTSTQQYTIPEACG
jgi:hypothetical protein